MSNLHYFRITVTGEGRDAVKHYFEQSAITTHFGTVWNLGLLRCDVQLGDGITVNPDSIEIRGESDGLPPFGLVRDLSVKYLSVAIEIAGTDLTNLYSQRWLFEAGKCQLLDCIEEADADTPEVVYVLDGTQHLPLPAWVPVFEEKTPHDDVEEADLRFFAELTCASSHHTESSMQKLGRSFTLFLDAPCDVIRKTAELMEFMERKGLLKLVQNLCEHPSVDAECIREWAVRLASEENGDKYRRYFTMRVWVGACDIKQYHDIEDYRICYEGNNKLPDLPDWTEGMELDRVDRAQLAQTDFARLSTYEVCIKLLETRVLNIDGVYGLIARVLDKYSNQAFVEFVCGLVDALDETDAFADQLATAIEGHECD